MEPVALAEEIEESYRRYLRTTFYFRDASLREGFEAALRSERLSKGPYLEATPVFKRGQRTGELFGELLKTKVETAFLSAVHGERALYAHQEQAIRILTGGDNAVVATGVGSGKSESFFYPILLHLYQEYLRGELGAGVRALVLYPMNALANDQRDRLGEISRHLADSNSPFQFTFGQYTGETPENRSDSYRRANDHLRERRPGELVFRSEMRSTPPHILLTNYSMLEYLLLRPDDSPLFDHGAAKWWTFLVLDEAHQYRGSRGTEMAMLLRRLKQRLREGGRSAPFRCIATSATLSRGEADRPLVAKFAADLFGERFTDPGVIFGQSESIPGGGPVSLSDSQYQDLQQALDGAATPAQLLDAIAEPLGIQEAQNPDSPLPQVVGHILELDSRAARLRRTVVGAANEVEVLADEFFPELRSDQRVAALSRLVGLLLRAQDRSGAPLLSARFHLFLRALEGAFARFGQRPQIALERRVDSDDGAGHFFELALCRECGQHYFVGRKHEGRLIEAVRDYSQSLFGAQFYRPLGATEAEEDDQPAEEKPVRKRKTKTEAYTLCLQCASLTPGNESTPSCGHTDTITVVRETPRGEDEDHADQVSRCGACGYTSGGRGPVGELIYGSDGPHAVVATTLHRSLPAERRKVLAFADGRQEAAYFAWYLENSYASVLHRHLLSSAILNASRDASSAAEGLSLRELSTPVRELLRTREVVPASMGGRDQQLLANRIVYREFLTDERRISLEGVGLIRWSLKRPPWLEIPGVLHGAPWQLDDAEAWDLMSELLNTMRTDRACELRGEEPVPAWHELELQPQMRFRIGSPGPRNTTVRAWDGATGKRAKLLVKLLARLQKSSPDAAMDDALSLLRHVWKAIQDADERAPTQSERLLLSVEDAKRLNPDWWRVHLVDDISALFRCDTCARIYPRSIRGVCPRFSCSGTLQPAQPAVIEDNHYGRLYRQALPGPMRVEEHTAQLAHEKAREFQRDFKVGRIHVLSCSTTFELGVDLGDLDVVFLRNVPPESFNYAQRVGRAGRRPGIPGFAVTYCRRGPHDLYHFNHPPRILSGKVRPPALTVRNAKIVGRHVTAAALSSFLRSHTERYGKIKDFCGDLSAPDAVKQVWSYLDAERQTLEPMLHAIVPPEAAAGVGLSNGNWRDLVAGGQSRLSAAQIEVGNDFRAVLNLERQAVEEREYRTASWAQRRGETIATEDLLAFLSRKAVIPKYGFPVDVVELDTQKIARDGAAFDVSLQRDLSIGISEFAPTSQLVANKALWESYGLKKVAEREWTRRFYKRCAQHQVFCQWNPGESEPPTPCGHRLPVHEYVVPIFGFVTNRDAKPGNPAERRSRVFTTRPYFVRRRDGEKAPDRLPAHDPVVSLQRASPGEMVVICEGRYGEGFYVCRSCGAGFREAQREHRTPFGRACKGMLESVSLGHEFVTDVLQLQFEIPSTGAPTQWLAFGLGYALVEGAAEVLQVPTTDLNATVAATSTPGRLLPPVVLYDNVPGGAGIVGQLEEPEAFREALAAAAEKLRKCDCGLDASCYGCLRSYRNQFAHAYLQRGPTLQYLEDALYRWAQ